MSVASAALQHARIAGAVLMMSLSAATAHGDPPRPDALKMRNAPRASSALATPSQPEVGAPALPQPTEGQPGPAAQADAAKADKAVKEASAALELCYALARRADASLAGQLTVYATVRADASVEVRAQAGALGNGYFARCVERKLGALIAVSQPPEATAQTRTIVLGAKAVAAR